MSTERYEARYVGRVIRTIRESYGWTRYKLAHKAGVSEAHLAKIEDGGYCIRIDILNRLCKALDMEITFPI